MKIPDNLSYSNEHLWLRPDGNGSWLAGITDYAQDSLGDIVYVEMPAVDKRLQAGVPCGLIESVKTASDLVAPLDGVVVEANVALQNTPEQINDAPYVAWIFKFRSDNQADLTKLLSAEAYRKLLNI
jgi:glycine cleavage system H protein